MMSKQIICTTIVASLACSVFGSGYWNQGTRPRRSTSSGSISGRPRTETDFIKLDHAAGKIPNRAGRAYAVARGRRGSVLGSGDWTRPRRVTGSVSGGPRNGSQCNKMPSYPSVPEPTTTRGRMNTDELLDKVKLPTPERLRSTTMELLEMAKGIDLPEIQTQTQLNSKPRMSAAEVSAMHKSYRSTVRNLGNVSAANPTNERGSTNPMKTEQEISTTFRNMYTTHGAAAAMQWRRDARKQNSKTAAPTCNAIKPSDLVRTGNKKHGRSDLIWGAPVAPVVVD